MADKGGRLPPDGRPPQAKGQGKNAKRHDLERPKTPGLHGSDLQSGDVQAMENGQRIAPATTQGPAVQGRPAQSQASQSVNPASRGTEVPDAIEFLGQRSQGTQVPTTTQGAGGDRFETWRPLLERLVVGPGSSGHLAKAYIEQMRGARQGLVNRPAAVIDMHDIDDGLEAMVTELERE